MVHAVDAANKEFVESSRGVTCPLPGASAITPGASATTYGNTRSSSASGKPGRSTPRPLAIRSLAISGRPRRLGSGREARRQGEPPARRLPRRRLDRQAGGEARVAAPGHGGGQSRLAGLRGRQGPRPHVGEPRAPKQRRQARGRQRPGRGRGRRQAARAEREARQQAEWEACEKEQAQRRPSARSGRPRRRTELDRMLATMRGRAPDVEGFLAEERRILNSKWTCTVCGGKSYIERKSPGYQLTCCRAARRRGGRIRRYGRFCRNDGHAELIERLSCCGRLRRSLDGGHAPGKADYPASHSNHQGFMCEGNST